MRSSIIAAAFAATALAVPFAEPDVITAYDTDVVYVTNVVTVTEGAQAPATTVAAADAAPTYDQGSNNWGGNGGWHWPHKHKTHKSKKTKTKTRTRTQQAAQPSPPPSYETTTWAPEPTQEPSPTQQPDPEPTQVSGYDAIVVEHHNVHRRNHSSPDLKWDGGLAATAQKIAESCNYAHNTEMDGGGYGQNIAAGVEGNNISAVITDLFYNGEIGYYGNMFGTEPNMAEFELWGHFSQIVWHKTNAVGCATQHCPQGLNGTSGNVAPYFTVCNYSPPGNWGSYDNQPSYATNVTEPLGHPEVWWNYGL